MPTANEVFRDWNIDGDPSSGRRQLKLGEIRQWGAGIEAVAGSPDALNAVAAKVPTTSVMAFQRPQDGGIFVGWSEMTVQTVGGARTLPARNPAFLNNGAALYVTTAGTGALTIASGLMNTALLQRERDGEIIILAAASAAGVTGRFAAEIVRGIEGSRTPSPVGEYGIGAIEHAAQDPSLETGRRTRTISTPGWYLLQPVEDHTTIRVTNASCTLDLSQFPHGRTVTVEATAGCRVHSGSGLFLGGAGNTATFSSWAVFRVMRLGGSPIPPELIFGPAATYSTTAKPAAARSVLHAGQSHTENGTAAGLLGGFVDTLLDGALIGGADAAETHHIVAGASNSAAVRTSSATRYWWDSAAGTPGPHLTDAIAAISAAVAAGQPRPEAMIWRLGETDAGPMSSGGTTFAQFKAGIMAVWNRMRTEAPGMRVIVSPPGSNDRPMAYTGMMGVRSAYRELAAENPTWVFLGHEMYDLPRPFDSLHPTDQGYYAAGVRDAMSYRRAMGATVAMGPDVTAAVLQADGTVRVTISMASGFTFLPAEDTGPHPYGLCIINHAQGMASEFPVLRGTAVANGGAGTAEITLYPASSPAGAYLFTVPGWFHDVRRRTYIRDNRWHGRSPGFPLRFQRLGPL